MARNERPYVVVIDPGHGGSDPGAVNETLGLKEADINLAVARILERQVLDGDYLFRPILARTGDVDVSMKVRCEISNKLQTDAFVSLHCNAAVAKEATGFEVWTTIGETAADALATEIYWGMQTANPDVHGRSEMDDGDPDKETNFYVLRNTLAPAVLVEMDFLSNDDRARWLANEDNQKAIAKEIADAIEFWLEGGK